MDVVKFSPSSMTPTQLTAQSTATEKGIHDNPTVFPTPPVPEAQLAAQRVIVQGLMSDQNAAALAFSNITKNLGTESGKMGNMLLQDATYIDGVAIVDPDTAKATANLGGFTTKKDPVHHHDLPGVIANVSITQGDLTGSADVHWDPNGSALYKVFYSLNVTAFSWQMGDSTNVSSITLHGLPVGVPIAFMVLGHNSNGDSDQSASLKVVKSLL
jgi:hypothetical protein